MKSEKELLKLYKKAKSKDGLVYPFETFKRDAKEFLKQIRKREFVLSMTVSRSGMTRKFNSINHNALLNICYNDKISFDKVKVEGCGMDMHWYLLFSVCECLTTKTDEKRVGYNSLCSHQPLI